VNVDITHLWVARPQNGRQPIRYDTIR